jgi:hypothetical protein
VWFLWIMHRSLGRRLAGNAKIVVEVDAGRSKRRPTWEGGAGPFLQRRVDQAGNGGE